MTRPTSSSGQRGLLACAPLLALVAACDGARTVDGGARDAASALDTAAMAGDASSLDAATTLDAREADDVSSLDAGSGDAGADAPLPLDAAVVSTFPLDHAMPAGTTMTSVTRLGDATFVLASVEDTDTSTAEGEALVLTGVRRVGHGLSFGPPTSYPEITIGPGRDNPIQLVEAIGPEHVVVILMRPDDSMALRLFALRGGAFVDLGGMPLVEGADFAMAPGFFEGHPIDDARYLLGYREGSSGAPVRYRVLRRTGDALSFGPPLTRPAPSAFPGLATTESQADPGLFRVGPSTFVEVRPGYVAPPGQLATWTLEVGDDDTLVARDPTVHATTTRTMIPEVAADGRGGAAIAYYAYGETDWHLGSYTHADRTLTDRGILGTSPATPLRAHQGESTDRFLGGAYYLRLVGDATTDAPLFRIDAATGSSERIGDVPDLYWCYRVPQVVRAGTLAAYPTCERVVFLDLLPHCGDGALDADEACDDGGNSDGDGCSAGCTRE